MSIYRQGDVLIMRVNSIPVDAVDITPKEGPLVLAYGEVTGHSHAFKGGGVALLERGPRRYLRVTETAAVTHEEHDPITLEVGLYETRDAKGHGIIQVEYTPTALRIVGD